MLVLTSLVIGYSPASVAVSSLEASLSSSGFTLLSPSQLPLLARPVFLAGPFSLQLMSLSSLLSDSSLQEFLEAFRDKVEVEADLNKELVFGGLMFGGLMLGGLMFMGSSPLPGRMSARDSTNWLSTTTFVRLPSLAKALDGLRIRRTRTAVAGLLRCWELSLRTISVDTGMSSMVAPVLSSMVVILGAPLLVEGCFSVGRDEDLSKCLETEWLENIELPLILRLGKTRGFSTLTREESFFTRSEP